jgi:hypothetical protein
MKLEDEDKFLEINFLNWILSNNCLKNEVKLCWELQETLKILRDEKKL